MSGDTRFGLGTVPCNQRDSQSFSLQVQQDTTILWGLPIYLCIPNIYLPMYLASQLNSYRFVYLSTCLFICLSTHLIISTMCVHTYIYNYIYISLYIFICICRGRYARVWGNQCQRVEYAAEVWPSFFWISLAIWITSHSLPLWITPLNQFQFVSASLVAGFSHLRTGS
jgi:hypothetical protein